MVRPMETTDAGGVYRASSEALVATAEEREEVGERSAEEIERRKERYRHFLKHDPGGAWVAADGERVVGVALALEREGVWILSLFAVDEEYRGAGVGRRLLDHALVYAEGCKGAMLASSTHPAAMRRYALAGFDLHPTLVAGGTVRRGSLPAGLQVREATEDGLQLAAEVDRQLRGAAHGPDLEHMLSTGSRLIVAERPSGMGYVAEHNGSPAVLAATEPGVAQELLWTCLERTPPGEKADVDWITGGQNWAVAVTLEAGLSLSPASPICTRGNLGPLTPYLPSGPFL